MGEGGNVADAGARGGALAQKLACCAPERGRMTGGFGGWSWAQHMTEQTGSGAQSQFLAWPWRGDEWTRPWKIDMNEGESVRHSTDRARDEEDWRRANSLYACGA